MHDYVRLCAMMHDNIRNLKDASRPLMRISLDFLMSALGATFRKIFAERSVCDITFKQSVFKCLIHVAMRCE